MLDGSGWKWGAVGGSKWKSMEVGGTISRYVEALTDLDDAFFRHDHGRFRFASTLFPLWELRLACTSFQTGNFHERAWKLPSTSKTIQINRLDFGKFHLNSLRLPKLSLASQSNSKASIFAHITSILYAEWMLWKSSGSIVEASTHVRNIRNTAYEWSSTDRRDGFDVLCTSLDNYYGFRVWRRSYLLWSRVIQLLIHPVEVLFWASLRILSTSNGVQVNGDNVVFVMSYTS